MQPACHYQSKSKGLTKSPKIYFVEAGLTYYLQGIENPDQRCILIYDSDQDLKKAMNWDLPTDPRFIEILWEVERVVV